MSHLGSRVRKLEGRCPTRPYAHLTDEELEAYIEKFFEGLLRKAGIWGNPALWQAWAEEVLLPQLPPDVTESLRKALKRLEDKITVPASLAEPCQAESRVSGRRPD